MNPCLRVRADPSALATWNVCLFYGHVVVVVLFYQIGNERIEHVPYPQDTFSGIVGQTTNGRIYLFVHRVALKILHGFVVSCWSGRFSKELVVVSSKKEKLQDISIVY